MKKSIYEFHLYKKAMKRLFNFGQTIFKQKKTMSTEGFEPSPCYRIAPEATALDRSAKLTS